MVDGIVTLVAYNEQVLFKKKKSMDKSCSPQPGYHSIFRGEQGSFRKSERRPRPLVGTRPQDNVITIGCAIRVDCVAYLTWLYLINAMSRARSVATRQEQARAEVITVPISENRVVANELISDFTKCVGEIREIFKTQIKHGRYTTQQPPSTIAEPTAMTMPSTEPKTEHYRSRCWNCRRRPSHHRRASRRRAQPRLARR
jgi:hypothetical protein